MTHHEDCGAVRASRGRPKTGNLLPVAVVGLAFVVLLIALPAGSAGSVGPAGRYTPPFSGLTKALASATNGNGTTPVANSFNQTSGVGQATVASHGRAA